MREQKHNNKKKKKKKSQHICVLCSRIMTCIENDKIEVDHSMDYYEIDERVKHQLPYIHSKRTHFKTPTLNHQSKMTFNGIFFCSARTHICAFLSLSLSLTKLIFCWCVLIIVTRLFLFLLIFHIVYNATTESNVFVCLKTV